MKTQKSNIRYRLAILCLVYLVLTQTPNYVRAQDYPINTSAKGVVDKYTNDRELGRFDVQYEGKIEFTDDDKMIKSISRGGYFRVRGVSFGQRREVFAEPDVNGSIIYEYRHGGKRANFNKDGKKWLSDILLEVIRTTGISAETRVVRIFRQKGIDKALEEVGDIKSDYVSHIYFGGLLSIREISDNDLKKVAGFVPKDLDSDYYIAEVFKNNGRQLLKNSQIAEAFVLGAMDKTRTDIYTYTILKRTLLREQSSLTNQKILDKIADMGSDIYKVDILKFIFEAKLSKLQLLSALKSAGTIGSDIGKSQVLKRGCFQVSRADDEVKSYYRKVAKGIRSDTDFGAVMRCIN